MIEKGRYQKIPLEQRLCVFCDKKEIEDETHFMLRCPCYDEMRKVMFVEIERMTGRKQEEFKTEEERLKFLLENIWEEEKECLGVVRTVMGYIRKSMLKRKVLEGVKSMKLDTVHLPRTRKKRERIHIKQRKKIFVKVKKKKR